MTKPKNGVPRGYDPRFIEQRVRELVRELRTRDSATHDGIGRVLLMVGLEELVMDVTSTSQEIVRMAGPWPPGTVQLRLDDLHRWLVKCITRDELDATYERAKRRITEG